MKITLTILVLILTISPLCRADDFSIPEECEIIIDDFAQGIKPGWEKQLFKGETGYTWIKEENRGFVRAASKNAASGLIYKVDFDPQQYPYIIWNWKVDNIIKNGDATKKTGDDYPARVYVVFPSLFFWKTRAVNYIWANRLPRNKAIPSSYTSNSVMVSVQSGQAETGRWLTETRNIYEDFQGFFGDKPSRVGAIAIMTDTDNTGESASASYGPIAVCSRNPNKPR
jgi:hypothetical protein